MTATFDTITLPTDLARRLAAEGAPPDDVERAIAHQQPWLDPEQRAAVWLVAWCAGELKPREPWDNPALHALASHGRPRPLRDRPHHHGGGVPGRRPGAL